MCERPTSLAILLEDIPNSARRRMRSISSRVWGGAYGVIFTLLCAYSVTSFLTRLRYLGGEGSVYGM